MAFAAPPDRARAPTARPIARIVALAVALGSAVSCAPSPAMLAARRGDREALRLDLERSESAGRISLSEAASLAKAVVERELAAAPPAEALEFVREVRPCAREIDGSLAARMRVHDAAGAEAALARIEDGSLDARSARIFLQDGDPRWRAVGVRGLLRREDREARRRALIDGSPLVRRQAVRAARDAADPEDLSALVEVARVDPEPIVRTEAVRAIAALPAAWPAGRGRAVVDVLRDLWTSGDDGLREDVALAWSNAALWGQGGRDALLMIEATTHGPPAVEAAAAVLGHRDAGAEAIAFAIARIASAIQSGPRVTRLQALARAPLDRPALMDAVRKASSDGDLAVRIAALARLAEANDRRAVADLEALAGPASPAASRARIALGMAGDRGAGDWLKGELASRDENRRIDAAVALAGLAAAYRAAPLLADPVARVRARASCVILMAAGKVEPRAGG